MSTNRNLRISVIGSLVIALVLGVAYYFFGTGSRGPTLTIVSFGGAYQAAQRKAYFAPFSEEFKVRVVEGDYNGDYGILKQRATAPTGSWDVVSVESAPCTRGMQEGIFQELPPSVFQGISLIPEARKPCAAGHLTFSTILAYDRERFPDSDAAPASWTDFWDVKRFPGRRGLRNNPRGTLEIALLADGASADKLYPLNLERAFAKLDELRPHLVFWESGAQPVQLLANKTVVMTSAYNGRIWDAKVKEKLPVEMAFRQGLMEVEYWAVPRNAPNREAAFHFIAFSLQANRQAAFSNEIAYGPTNPDALAFISNEVKDALPTAASVLPSQIPVNAEWWAENEAQVSARWEQWQGHK